MGHMTFTHLGSSLPHRFWPWWCELLWPMGQQEAQYKQCFQKPGGLTGGSSFSGSSLLGWSCCALRKCRLFYMAFGPITSWQIDGKTVTDFIFLCSKITVDGDCSHEIKRRLLLGRKVMTNLDSILKSRDITLPTTKTPLVKAMVFPVSHVWM